LVGLLLRLVRAGECRVGHDPTAHGCLAALRALDSRERLASEKDHFGELMSARFRPGHPVFVAHDPRHAPLLAQICAGLAA